MTDFPVKKKVIQIQEKEVVIYDLSIGFIIEFEANGQNLDWVKILLDGSNLKEEEVTKLRKSEAEFLVNEIMKLTYGETLDSDNDSEGEEKKS